jgi:molecular chaperone DnaK
MNQDQQPAPIESHLRNFQVYICSFLRDSLPSLCIEGSDWWTLLVRSIPRLKGSQSSRIRAGSIRKIEDLDLVSLCGVLKHNWRSLCERLNIDDHQRVGALQCDVLINLRNTLSHMGAGMALSEEDSLTALLSIKKLGGLVGAPTTLIEEVNRQIRILSRSLAVTDEHGTPVESGAEASEPLREHPILPCEDKGIPLSILACEGEAREEIVAALSLHTFIGIDFGTSTTVASRVYLDPEKGALASEPIPLPQFDDLGIQTDSPLLPTCIAWHEKKLLVGQGAARLKPQLAKDRNVWFSFKMDLGPDLGPQYSRSELDGKNGNPEVRRPQDIAALFFDYLRTHIERWVAEKGLPSSIRYAVSVPAAFEANQRLDLCEAMKRGGIGIEENGIIDEPNAAFINYLLRTLDVGDGVLKSFSESKKRIMVFDFGAGTCDISVLEVSGSGGRLLSRNLAISQFRALGGDNIDRQIARKILWPMMLRESGLKDDQIREIDFKNGILPRLLPAAEQLKIQCCKLLDLRAEGGDVTQFKNATDRIKADAVRPMKIREFELSLNNPSISFSDFFEIMRPFLECEPEDTEPDVVSIFDPIENALGKTGIQKGELDLVVFIGGSAQNPLVQHAVRKYFGRFVSCDIGADIRTPVSRGAALHSLAWNGLDLHFIRPITSETIFILTAGNALHEVIPAGSLIPTPEIVFTDALIVPNEQQAKVELPICVSTANKVLHILELKASRTSPFRAGDRITLSASLDQNKLLNIKAKIGTTMAVVALSNPLSNEELTTEETARLIARQKLNASCVQNGGPPSPEILKAYADACANSGAHLEAAEAYESLERIEEKYKTGNNATQICFHYSCARKTTLSDHWAEMSHKRDQSWTSAFNLALAKENGGRKNDAMELLEEANQLSPNNPIVMSVLGNRLLTCEQRDRGRQMLSDARDIFREMLHNGSLRQQDLGRSERLASFLNDRAFQKELEAYADSITSRDNLFSEEYLAATVNQNNLTR